MIVFEVENISKINSLRFSKELSENVLLKPGTGQGENEPDLRFAKLEPKRREGYLKSFSKGKFSTSAKEGKAQIVKLADLPQSKQDKSQSELEYYIRAIAGFDTSLGIDVDGKEMKEIISQITSKKGCFFFVPEKLISNAE